MTDCRIKARYQKTSTARKAAPLLKTLPPTDESFEENVKRGILQTLLWYATMEASPPDLDVTMYGWLKDSANKVLIPKTIPGCTGSTRSNSKHG